MPAASGGRFKRGGQRAVLALKPRERRVAGGAVDVDDEQAACGDADVRRAVQEDQIPRFELVTERVMQDLLAVVRRRQLLLGVLKRLPRGGDERHTLERGWSRRAGDVDVAAKQLHERWRRARIVGQ